ncbi:MAG: glycoside hydrolase family 130 protein, partial [Robiginitalea sp.]|nr:glycoside hydrolase family 130 protein [Robiginitalea sp.]
MVRTFLSLCLLCLPNLLLSQEPWLTGFEKPAENPILKADSTYQFDCPVRRAPVRWQRADVFNPAAVVRNDTVFLFFRAEDNPKAHLGGRTSRIGLAWSTDGIHFQRHPEPVLYPERDAFQKWEYPGGVEDPRVVELADGSYLMLYTSWNQETARLSSATSTDLVHWEKHGPVFETAHKGAFLDRWSKSGAVVTEFRDGRLIAKKISGNYLMYWGERFVNLATSKDGRDWTPTLDDSGQLLESFRPTPEDFDSHLVEPGPPALYTEKGILLIYNGKNLSGAGAGSSTPEGTYCGGQVLF